MEKIIEKLQAKLESLESQIERLESADQLSEAGETRLERLTEQRDAVAEAIDTLEAVDW